MHFALLGHDEYTEELADAIARLRYDVTTIWDAEPCRAMLVRAYPKASWPAHWSAILESDQIDVTVVARGMDQEIRVEQLKLLAQTGGAALISHPLHPSVLVYFELEMICAESKARLAPYCPWRWRPGVPQLAEWSAAPSHSPLGPCEQLVIERASANRDDASVMEQFIRDVDLAMSLVGDLNGLSAMCPRWETIGLANLGVQMTGPAGILVRWSVGPEETVAGARISLLGPLGKAVLTLPDDGSPEQLQYSVGAELRTVALGDDDSCAAALQAFVERPSSDRNAPDWHAAARGMELADSIELSLRKGKTIPLYNTAPSEQGTFKGVMAATGCFLLFASLGLILLGLLLARLGVPHADKLPYGVAALLIVFLLLQSLRFAFPRST